MRNENYKNIVTHIKLYGQSLGTLTGPTKKDVIRLKNRYFTLKK